MSKMVLQPIRQPIRVRSIFHDTKVACHWALFFRQWGRIICSIGSLILRGKQTMKTNSNCSLENNFKQMFVVNPNISLSTVDACVVSEGNERGTAKNLSVWIRSEADRVSVIQKLKLRSWTSLNPAEVNHSSYPGIFNTYQICNTRFIDIHRHVMRNQARIIITLSYLGNRDETFDQCCIRLKYSIQANHK